MSYIKSCLIIAILAGAGNVYACDKGDMNQDGLYNVLDIVTLANCVLDDDDIGSCG